MEQHPVPQNVTTFQFRLIGDMTLKQFGYLCAGAILAFIAYKLPFPFIITWPLTIIFAFLGIGFAFVPIEERPMDVWVFSFFKSVYSPTQYLWSKEPATHQPSASAAPATPPAAPAPAGQSAITSPGSPRGPATPPPGPSTPIQAPSTPAAPTPSAAALSSLFQNNTNPRGATLVHSAKKPSVWEMIMSFFTGGKKQTVPVSVQQPVTPPVPTEPARPIPSVTGTKPVEPPPVATPQPPPTAKNDEAAKQKISDLEERLQQLQQQLSSKSDTEQRILELQKQLTDVLSQKSQTEDELVSLRRQVTPKSPQPNDGTPQQGGRVNVITTQEGAVKAGLPRLTNTPNVITGIVKDDGGNLLPGILVTVTNREGVPMRALKTNKLGQFGASTPLAPDTYFVEIEDPRKRFTFSRVQITLNGAVVPVLEVIAKSQKVLTREKLAQEIFGGQPMQ